MAASVAQDQYDRGHAFPHPFDLALFMRDFDAEVQAPYVPAWMVRVFVRPAGLVRPETRLGRPVQAVA